MPDLIPREWYIDANEFDSPQLLAQHLRRVAANETLYNAYHAARMGEWPGWFLRRWNFTGTPQCRLCRKIAAMREPEKYSDTATQTLRLRRQRFTAPRAGGGFCAGDSDCTDERPTCLSGKCGCTSNRECGQELPECNVGRSQCQKPVCEDVEESHNRPLARNCTYGEEICQAGMHFDRLMSSCQFFSGLVFEEPTLGFKPLVWHPAFWYWVGDQVSLPLLLRIVAAFVSVLFILLLLGALLKRRCRKKERNVQEPNVYGQISSMNEKPNGCMATLDDQLDDVSLI